MQTSNDEDFSTFLKPTPTIESAHPDVISFAEKHSSGTDTDRETAVRLYYAVRDEIRYDPYSIVLTEEGLKATQTLRAGRGWCVAKAILLAACCRALHIPARLGYADVRNHLSTARMRQIMNSDIFYWHGYTAIHLEHKWVKATPAFNIELCNKFNLIPLEFDGRSDSIFHPFDAVGNRHMEYLNFRGEFADAPIDAIEATFRDLYGATSLADRENADFDADVEKEMKEIKNNSR